ncbi:MAG: sigma-70 family RNA polymerase sigma factor [Chthoniobacterales bacterium]
MAVSNRNLPQLYRFCFLMTGDAAKAQDVFQATVREAAMRAARGDAASDRLWFFRDARGRCLRAMEEDLQAEALELDEREISPSAPARIARLDAEQLAIWISAAPEPQRSALAFYYIDEFAPREMLSLLEMKVPELARLVASARRQFQAWLDATIPHEEEA